MNGFKGGSMTLHDVIFVHAFSSGCQDSDNLSCQDADNLSSAMSTRVLAPVGTQHYTGWVSVCCFRLKSVLDANISS